MLSTQPQARPSVRFSRLTQTTLASAAALAAFTDTAAAAAARWAPARRSPASRGRPARRSATVPATTMRLAAAMIPGRSAPARVALCAIDVAPKTCGLAATGMLVAVAVAAAFDSRSHLFISYGSGREKL